jgi:hypothetical protein
MTSLELLFDHALLVVASSSTKNPINSATEYDTEPHFVGCTLTQSFHLSCGRHECPLSKHW